MGEVLGLLAQLLFGGIVYVALRLTLGPGKYNIIVDTIANSLLVLCFFGGISVLVLFAARSDPMDATLWLCFAVFACGALVGVGMLWYSAYALWFWRRPLAEVDSQGVRLWALAYRHVAWTDIAAVRNRSDNTEITDWVVHFRNDNSQRLGYLPLKRRCVIVGWGREPSEITAAAELIRSHPSYREEKVTA